MERESNGGDAIEFSPLIFRKFPQWKEKVAESFWNRWNVGGGTCPVSSGSRDLLNDVDVIFYLPS